MTICTRASCTSIHTTYAYCMYKSTNSCSNISTANQGNIIPIVLYILCFEITEHPELTHKQLHNPNHSGIILTENKTPTRYLFFSCTIQLISLKFAVTTTFPFLCPISPRLLSTRTGTSIMKKFHLHFCFNQLYHSLQNPTFKALSPSMAILLLNTTVYLTLKIIQYT